MRLAVWQGCEQNRNDGIIREGAVRRFEQLGLKDANEQLDNYCQNGIFLEVEKGAITAEGFCDKAPLQKWYNNDLHNMIIGRIEKVLISEQNT